MKLIWNLVHSRREYTRNQWAFGSQARPQSLSNHHWAKELSFYFFEQTDTHFVDLVYRYISKRKKPLLKQIFFVTFFLCLQPFSNDKSFLREYVNLDPDVCFYVYKDLMKFEWGKMVNEKMSQKYELVMTSIFKHFQEKKYAFLFAQSEHNFFLAVVISAMNHKCICSWK